MRLLIADDDRITLRLLEATVVRAGHDVTAVTSGDEAWRLLSAAEGPKLAILDWMMPGMDGIEICRRLRDRAEIGYVYILMLTSRRDRADLVTGFDAGADDYLIKPFDPLELLSRVAVGERLQSLQNALGDKVAELESALSHVRQLQGLIPICMHCKKIRDDASVWHRLETYIQEHSEAVFTHSLCEACLQEHYPNYEDAVVDGGETTGQDGAGRKNPA